MTYEERLSAAKFRAERDIARQDAYVAESKLTDAIKEVGEAKRKAAELGKLLNESNHRVHDLKREVEKLRWELERLRRNALRSEIVDQSMDNIEREIKLGVNSIAELLEIGGEIQELPIAEVCPRIVAELEKRLMPEGYEWPRFEDGEPVRFGDVGLDVHGKRRKCYRVMFTNAGFTYVFDDIGRAWWVNDCGPLENPEIDPGKRVKRPAVLAADNKPLEAGQTVWHVEYGTEWCVTKAKDGKVFIAFEDFAAEECDPSLLTHQRPVLDADGVLIKKGDTVYGIETGNELVVDAFVDDGSHGPYTVDCHFAVGGEPNYYRPDKLTHTKPEPQDSWERIEEDAAMQPYAYCVGNGLFEECDEIETIPTNELFARDLVRRCKALAERGEQE